MRSLLVVALLICLPACNSTVGSNGSTGRGGTGGSAATGGTSGGSGTTGRGGASGTGGTGGAGGTVGTGGAIGTGGASGSGGVDPCSFTACGGSLVGTWQYTGVCYDKTPTTSTTSCPTTAMTIDMQVSGPITFNSDGTWHTESTYTNAYTESAPASCIDQAGCNQYKALFGTSDCVFDATAGCLCTVRTTTTVTQMGPYTVSGNQYTLVAVYPNTTTMATRAYCISGDTLQVQDPNGGPIFILSKSP